MDPRRVVLVGRGDLADETEQVLQAAQAEVRRLHEPVPDEVRNALAEGADVVLVVSRDDAWPLRASLLVRHIDADVPIIATIFDPVTGRQLEKEIGNCKITALADIVAGNLAGPCLGDFASVIAAEGERPLGLRCNDDRVMQAPLPAADVRRYRAFAAALLRPFDRSAGLVFFGSLGLLTVLLVETISAAIVLDQHLVDAFYGGVKTLTTVDPNPEVQNGPKWFKLFISATMIIALVFAAAFTGGLVERLVGRNLTGLWGRRAVPKSDHVIVVGLGQVGLALCLLLRRCGYPVVAIDDREDDEHVGLAREKGLPVVIGRGADSSLLRRLALDRAMALAAVTADDLQNIKVALSASALAPDLRLVLRAGSDATRGETHSLQRLGEVRDVNRIGAAYLGALALGAVATDVVVDGDHAHLRDESGTFHPLPFTVAG